MHYRSSTFFRLFDRRRSRALRASACRRRCGGYLQCGHQRLRDRRRHWRSRQNGVVYAPDGEVVSPYGFVAGHDALVKMYASFMKPGDKQVDTLASSHMIGDVAFCTGGYTFTPASATSGAKGFWTKIVGKVGGEWKILNLTYAAAAPQ